MEDFGKIKEITLEEAKKILSKDIAYLTMNDGEIIIVNGLDHMKFDQKEKEYEDWMEEQTKSKFNTNIIENGLLKIPEDNEEYKRNTNLLNTKKLYKTKNIQNNFNQDYYQTSIPQQRNNNNFSLDKNQQYQNGINSNNSNHLFYKSNEVNNRINNRINNRKNNRINNISIQNGRNNINSQRINIPQKRYFINSSYNQNNNNNSFRYRKEPRNVSYEPLFKPYTPIIKRLHIQTGNNERKREYDKYICYNNHIYFERK